MYVLVGASSNAQRISMALLDEAVAEKLKEKKTPEESSKSKLIILSPNK